MLYFSVNMTDKLTPLSAYANSDAIENYIR
jgi:hypothetical protein